MLLDRHEGTMDGKLRKSRYGIGKGLMYSLQ